MPPPPARPPRGAHAALSAARARPPLAPFARHVERQLSGAWLSQQAVKELAVARALFPAYSLRQRMLHLLHNLQYYMVFEVIEPRWHELEPRVRAASSVDEVIARHDDFLDSCLKETMLRDAGLLKLLARLLTICVIFADFTAVVMSSVDAVLAAAELSHQNVRDDSARAPGAGKPAMPQGKRRRMHIAVSARRRTALAASASRAPRPRLARARRVTRPALRPGPLAGRLEPHPRDPRREGLRQLGAALRGELQQQPDRAHRQAAAPVVQGRHARQPGRAARLQRLLRRLAERRHAPHLSGVSLASPRVVHGPL